MGLSQVTSRPYKKREVLLNYPRTCAKASQRKEEDGKETECSFAREKLTFVSKGKTWQATAKELS